MVANTHTQESIEGVMLRVISSHISEQGWNKGWKAIRNMTCYERRALNLLDTETPRCYYIFNDSPFIWGLNKALERPGVG